MILATRIALLALAIAGTTSCGTKDLSRDDFVAAAGETCRNANQQLDLIPSPSPVAPGGEEAALADYLERALQINEEAADTISALRAPDELRADRDAMVEAMTEANEGLEEAAEAADSGDQDALARAVAAMTESQNRFRSVAGRLGIRACLGGGVTAS